MIGLKKISSGEKAPFFLPIRDFIQLDQAEFLRDVAGNIDSTSRKPTRRLHIFWQISFHTVVRYILFRNEKRIPRIYYWVLSTILFKPEYLASP